MSAAIRNAPEPVGKDQPVPAVVDHATARSIIAGIMLAMFLSALEQTIVAPALPTIGRSLADVEGLSWVVTAYLLSATVVTPLFGKISDIYGRRIIMLISVSIFIVGSIACALAPTMWALVAARTLQGIGGGGILPLAQTVIADILSPRERPLFQSYSSVMFMSSSILGPVLGGFLTDYVHWSLIFWINVPLGAVALITTDRALRRLPRHEQPHRLDLIGAGLMLAAALALLLALNWGGTRYAWSSMPVLGLIGSSAALWALFARRLVRAPEPFIPWSLVKEPVVGTIVVAGFFCIGVIIGLSIFIPLYLELVLGMSASASGLALIALMAGATVGSLSCGRLLSRLERYKRVPLLALPPSIVMLVVLAIWPSSFSPAGISAVLALTGIGLGTMYPMTTVIIQNAVLPHQLGTATGTLNFFRQLGGAIIVAVFGAIVLGGADRSVSGALPIERLSHAADTDYALLFRWVFIAAAVFLVAGLAAVLLVKERPLRGPAGAQPASTPLAVE